MASALFNTTTSSVNPSPNPAPPPIPSASGAPQPGIGAAVSGANKYQLIFNQAYYESKPSSFWPLFAGRPDENYTTGVSRTDRWAGLTQLSATAAWALVGLLIQQGYIVDEEIDAEGMDPYTGMFFRQLYGNTWEPAGLGETESSQVLTPGMYTGPVPAGQIKVSTLLEDFPAWVPPANNAPVVPPIPQSGNPVGVRIIPQVPSAQNYVGDVFRCAVANDGFNVGQTWTGTSGAFQGTWTKQAMLAGMMIVWTKTA